MKKKSPGDMPTSVEMLAYVVAATEAKGWPPSRREAADHFGISLERAQRILMQCREDKLIEVGSGARQVKVTPYGQRRINQMKQIRGRGTQL